MGLYITLWTASDLLLIAFQSCKVDIYYNLLKQGNKPPGNPSGFKVTN